MRKKFAAKELLIVALTLGFVIGCASTPEEEQGDEDATVQAINDARSALDAARSAGCEDWQGIADMISDAEAAAAEGNDDEAQRLARNARSAAERCEREARQQAQATKNYTVVRGDNLWDISAKGSIYGDPYRWPLIYKRNSGKINDADLIEPGQVFTIDENPSQSEVNAAVNHARTRGSWSLGTTEQSDRDYLAGR